MYKIGLTYKRMDIQFNDLRQEFKRDSHQANERFNKELSQTNEMVHQVRDEVEQSQKEQQKLCKQFEKQLKEFIRAKQEMTEEGRKWSNDADAVAVVTSCIVEYLSMQTAIDNEAFEMRSLLLRNIKS